MSAVCKICGNELGAGCRTLCKNPECHKTAKHADSHRQYLRRKGEETPLLRSSSSRGRGNSQPRKFMRCVHETEWHLEGHLYSSTEVEADIKSGRVKKEFFVDA